MDQFDDAKFNDAFQREIQDVVLRASADELIATRERTHSQLVSAESLPWQTMSQERLELEEGYLGAVLMQFIGMNPAFLNYLNMKCIGAQTPPLYETIVMELLSKGCKFLEKHCNE